MSKQTLALAALMIALLFGALFLDFPVPIAVAITLAPAFIAVEIDLIRRMKALKTYYQNRQVFYRLWLSRYGKERKDKIKRYLRLYSHAFGIGKDIIHKIGPDDGVMDYYNRNYQPGDADSMEDVALVRALKKEYGYEVTLPDGKLSLGALFEKVTKRT
ncbi:MAG: hypothetical protein QM715_15040 [Nibricoccus sp.]